MRALSYEAYPGMAERAMAAIGREIESQVAGDAGGHRAPGGDARSR